MLRRTFTVMAALAAAGLAAGCLHQRAAASESGIDPAVRAAIHDLRQKRGDKLVRVIVTVKHTGDIAAAQRQFITALKNIGAEGTPIEGLPMVVTECLPEQLEAVMGLIEHIQEDRLDKAQ